MACKRLCERFTVSCILQLSCHQRYRLLFLWHGTAALLYLLIGSLISIRNCGITGYWLLCLQVAVLDGSQDSQSRLPSSIKNFSMSQKEKTLDELIRDRWLSYTATGKIGLGTRSFLDLRSWFRGNDIPSCVVCNEACIKVLICDDSMGFQLPCLASVVVVV